MVNSRNITELHPFVQKLALKFLSRCRQEGIDLIITCTHRDIESQNALYAIGRTVKGKKVTNAKGGDSFHNYRVALDVVPLRNGKPVWGTKGADLELWKKVGAIGKECGLTWAGDWVGNLVEFAHFQATAGLTIADFKQGKQPKYV